MLCQRQESSHILSIPRSARHPNSSCAFDDGTGVRDYIHVVDLAIGHVKAIEKLNSHSGMVTYNLGTGKNTVTVQYPKKSQLDKYLLTYLQLSI